MRLLQRVRLLLAMPVVRRPTGGCNPAPEFDCDPPSTEPRQPGRATMETTGIVRMLQPLLVLLLLCLPLLPTDARAETNACFDVPADGVIFASGAWCLHADRAWRGTVAERTIHIAANDITLDCNGHRIVGPVLAPDVVLNDYTIGIYVGVASRITVRNCHVDGFRTGIDASRSDQADPRPRDVTLEDNTLSRNGWGIYFATEGDNRIRNNVITDASVRGIESYAGPGRVTISDNLFVRIGDTVYNEGRGGYFSSEIGGWMVVEGNVFSEVVAPSGVAGSPAVRLGPGGGVGVMFTGNRILAPANPAEKGTDTVGIDNSGGNGCENNLTVGYGTAPIANCTVPTNEQR
jgi:parallel beta-helix repeat protein